MTLPSASSTEAISAPAEVPDPLPCLRARVGKRLHGRNFLSSSHVPGFRKFAGAKEYGMGILSLPNVWLGHGARGGPYEESGRGGVSVAGWGDGVPR